MEQLKNRGPVLMIVVVLLAGGIFYLVGGGPGGGGGDAADPAKKKPFDAFEMTVSSVQETGTFRGKVERSGRYAQDGIAVIGTDDRVTLTLADLEQPDPVRDPCWIQESQEALKDQIGARIWVDADTVERDRLGGFRVFAWNRDDAFVQEELLRAGDAKLVAGRLTPGFGTALEEAEDAGAAAERGLWGACGEQ